jgi:hypothetical protein
MTATTKMSQSQILQRLGIPTTQAEVNEINGNGRLQQYINQQATLHHLPQPFNPSVGSTILQDLIPLAGLAGGAALTAGEVNAATGATAGAEGGAAGAGAGTAASKIASNIPKAIGTAATAAVISQIWTALTKPSNWLRALELVGGAVLVFMALKALTGVNTPSILPAVATVA